MFSHPRPTHSMPTLREVGRGFFVHSRQNEINTLVQAFDVIQTTNWLQSPRAAKQGIRPSVAPEESDPHVNLCFVKVQKMVSSNGRWRVPDDSDEPKDPDNDFPFQQTFTDCSGQQRDFVFSCFHTDLGFGVQAEEEGKDGEGFFFREFDATSPYLALVPASAANTQRACHTAH